MTNLAAIGQFDLLRQPPYLIPIVAQSLTNKARKILSTHFRVREAEGH